MRPGSAPERDCVKWRSCCMASGSDMQAHGIFLGRRPGPTQAQTQARHGRCVLAPCVQLQERFFLDYAALASERQPLPPTASVHGAEELRPGHAPQLFCRQGVCLLALHAAHIHVRLGGPCRWLILPGSLNVLQVLERLRVFCVQHKRRKHARQVHQDVPSFQRGNLLRRSCVNEQLREQGRNGHLLLVVHLADDLVYARRDARRRRLAAQLANVLGQVVDSCLHCQHDLVVDVCHQTHGLERVMRVDAGDTALCAARLP